MSRIVTLGFVWLAVSVVLHGCGGGGGGKGGGDGGGGDGPSPGPTPPTPAPPAQMPISVLSYNLQWHSRHGMENIGKTIKANLPGSGNFDLMGMQECENTNEVVAQLPGTTWGTMQLTDGPHDIGIAWDAKKFKKLSQGFAPVGKDPWWTRIMQWARLQIIGTNDFIFLANTHGAIGSCNKTQGPPGSTGADVVKYITDTINTNMQKGDHLFFTGDFNCQSYDDVIKSLSETFKNSAQASWFFPIMYQPDHIFTNKDTDVVNSTGVCCHAPGVCAPDKGDGGLQSSKCVASPSDHQLLKGNYMISLGGKSSDEVVV